MAAAPAKQASAGNDAPVPEILIDDDDLRVGTIGDAGDHLVVSFSGIGAEDRPVQHAEFTGLASARGTRPALFVIDKRRSWYTTPGLVDRIVGVVRDRLASSGATELTLMGSSMGGLGAVLFSKYLPARRAIAFSPQFSMDRSVIWEHRWKVFRPNIRPAPLKSCAEAVNPETRYYIVFGNYTHDLKHRWRFQRVPQFRTWVIPGTGHNIGKIMKIDGTLDRAVEAMFVDDLPEIEAAIADSASRKRSWVPFYNLFPT